MKKTLTAIAAAALLVACSASSKTQEGTTSVNTLSKNEKSGGWQLLFDGQSKAGWHVYNNKTDGAAWVVEDGTLHLNPQEGKGGGDIVTEKEYENFHLKLDWKLEPGGNSGVIFYSKEDPKYKYGWETGPEIQVLDNERHPDAKIIKHRSCDLYDLISSSPEVTKPAGEWNQLEIISNKGNFQVHMNGTKVLETTLWDDNYRALIAKSKFRNMPDFGKFQKGKLSLQDHGNKVWYKNVKIKEL